MTPRLWRHPYIIGSGWRGDMTLDQLALIERTFTRLTPNGWDVPIWVRSLRAKIIVYSSLR